jgi:ligand-binding sensor domain-containing protein/two-component sensor histidine kinase
MKLFLKYLFKAFLFFVPVVLSGQQYNFQYFSVAEGLAQSQVYSMIEDHHGYLWMGTQGGGLNRFDGQEFTTFTVSGGLINNSVDVLYEANNLLHVGAKNGMSIYDGREFKNYFVSKEQNISITALQWYNDVLLVGTTIGVFEFSEEKFKFSQKYNGDKKSRVFCFFKDSKNRLWVGTRNGLLLFESGKVKTFGTKEGITVGEVTGICEDQKGDIWLTTYNGVYSFDGKVFTNLNKEKGIASNYLNNLICDKNGQIWLASQDNGISIWNNEDSTITQLNAEKGLCNDNVRVILQDSWGSIWIATSGGGVCKYAGQQFQHFNISDRPADNLVYSLCQDSSGKFWFSAADDGIVRLDSTGFTKFGAKEGFTNSKTKAMLSDTKGRLWFGTNDDGIAYFDGASFEFLKYRNRTLGKLTKDIVEDELGNIWVASSSEGVYKINPGDSTIQVQQINLDTFNFNDSIVIQRDTIFKDSIIFTYQIEKIAALNKSINALHFDKIGRLWFATKLNGIGYYNENGVVMYNESFGLPANDIRSIIEDDKGHLWIGTAGYGIASISVYTDTLDIQVFNEKNGLSSSNVYLMIFDGNGDLWVGCGRGVDRISLDEEQQFKSMKSYGKADGFLGVETCQNAVINDQEGNLWFGTIDGVTKFLPGSRTTNLIPPKLRITGIELANESFEKSEYSIWLDKENVFKNGLELPHNKNKLSFDFAGINLSNPQKVTYEWMLEGSDEDWSKRSSKNSITYSSLPPGQYVFKVRAYNEDLIANDPPLQMSFCILSPIWKRWWFITGCILLISGVVALFFINRINKIRSKAKAEQERLEMENNLLQLEQKALQLQMNPHFIFNALNTVQSLFMSNEQSAARQLLSKFAKLMRSILENSRVARIPLQKEIDLLDNYLAIEQFSRPGKFDYKIEVDASLDTAEVNIPPMMIQPFVENAIIHGVSHLKSGGLILLNFKKEEDQLICIVRDNGIGRMASAKIKEQNTRKHKSIALDVTKERLTFLNQNKNHKNLIINDLGALGVSEKGTEVLIYLPLEEW